MSTDFAMGKQAADFAKEVGGIQEPVQTRLATAITAALAQMKDQDPQNKCNTTIISAVFQDKAQGLGAPAHTIGMEFDKQGNLLSKDALKGDDATAVAEEIAFVKGEPIPETPKDLLAPVPELPTGKNYSFAVMCKP